MISKSVTRGFGLFETFLSMKRIKMVKKLIEKYKKNGRVLDIGCGSYPFFLMNMDFKEKYGLDKEICNHYFKYQNLMLIKYNIGSDLPFQNSYFDVITLLAVIEHLSVDQMYKILTNCYYLLRKNGILIITTPAKWGNTLLKFMAKMNLVSSEEIEDHKFTYSLRGLKDILRGVNFKCNNIYGGYFEFFLNLWVYSIK